LPGEVVSFRMAESQSVNSVMRAVDLVESLASADGDLSLSELARRTRLQPPTAHRLLRTLVRTEWVVQNPATSHYRLSHKLLALCGDLDTRIDWLRAAARSHLEELRDATSESTNLVILDGLTSVFIDQAPSLRPIRMFTEPGARIPSYACGAGKAMLAYQPPAVLDKLERTGLKRLTARTITDRAALERELERIRRRGYAVDNGENETGVVCIAAPILGPGNVALAAISVSAPPPRLPVAGRQALANRLIEHARQISCQLGYDGSHPG
jgi:IclR family transcriptional regulator, acetate operon repressor